MKPEYKIFLVEDDPNFGSVLKAYLEINDFSVTLATDGNKAARAFMEDSFDLCILDVMLPGQDGFDVASGIKKTAPGIPFIFLTAKTMKDDILKGYSLGADDYITKPFDSEVLLCKIRAILSRISKSGNQNIEREIFTIGTFSFDPSLRTVTSAQTQFKLSPKESDLLELLCRNKNETLPREVALKTLWGDDNYFTTRSMDVFISKLRRYFSKDPEVQIMNLHGKGFRLLG